MKILAWYSLILIVILIAFLIKDEELEGNTRLKGILLFAPMFIFILNYIFGK